MRHEPEDLLLLNGRIWTSAPSGPEVSALLLRGGRVAAVGDSEQVRAVAGPARRVDLQRSTVLPGLIDAHCHLLWYGQALRRWVELRDAATVEEIQARLRARLAGRSPGSEEWILGRGFDQDRLPGARVPTTADLDAVSTEAPVVIQRVCGHALVANTRAQALSGVQAPDGFLAEDDMAPVWSAAPAPSPEENVSAAARGCQEAAAAGFTGAHCIVSRQEEIEAFRELARRGPLPIHLRLFAGDLKLLDPPGIREAVPCRTLKLFADGSLGAHTAALSLPYADMPATCGRLLLTEAELRERVAAAHAGGYQVATHAIGDAAIAAAVEAIAAAQAECPRPDARHRIEHASVLPPVLVDRIAALGIIAAVQPQFTISDFWTESRLGPARLAWAYPFQALLARGAVLAGSTDCPVEALDPFQAISRAMLRQPESQRLSAAEAIALFTRGAAYAGFQELERGALHPGCYADLVILPADPRMLAAAEIASLRPELTLVEGRVAHAAGRFADLA